MSLSELWIFQFFCSQKYVTNMLVVKNPLANTEGTRDVGKILGGNDPLEEEMATTPAFLLRQSHGQRSWMTIVHGIARVRNYLVTKPNQYDIHGR